MILFYLPPKWTLKDELSNKEKEAKVNDFYRFRNLFNDWTMKYSMQKDWLRETVFWTLSIWNTYRDYTRNHLMYPSLAYDIPGGTFANFEAGGWAFTKQDDKKFIKNEIKKFTAFINSYVEKTKKQAKADGFKPFRRPKEFNQLKWLVCWTVQNRTMKEIFAEYDKSNTSDAVIAYNRFERKVNKAFDVFKEYDLPVRVKRQTVINS